VKRPDSSLSTPSSGYRHRPASSNSRTPLVARPYGTLDHRTQSTRSQASSFNSRSGRAQAMMDVERSRTRRERTFVGSECAVCEEPLEHTLRGERILQFSCGHVSHEACFYEYIKEFESQYCPTCNAPLGLDTSRGGNILDLGMSPIQPMIFQDSKKQEKKYKKVTPTIYVY
jgi:hypothetical protein